MKKTLVTGAAGFIGIEVVRLLVAGGHEVIAVLRHGSRPNARLDALGEAVTTRHLDLSNEQAVSQLMQQERPGSLVHLAWYARPEDYLRSRQNLQSLSMTGAVVAAALDAGCRKLVLAGTCLEYADLGQPRRETDPADPTSLYASCKYSAWLLASALARSAGADLAWGRIFHLHGPAEAEGRIIPWVARQLDRGQPVDLTDGLQVRDHLHVEDVAGAFVTLLLSPLARGIFNVCSGEQVTLRHVLETVGHLKGRPELLRFGVRAHRPDEIMTLSGDPGRLRALGWAPTWSLVDGLRDALTKAQRNEYVDARNQ